ncbi:MAG: ABC transporter permease [Acidobacteria bacterium]|nr:ABC transporter permease [Acidobacteriota bacterium]
MLNKLVVENLRHRPVRTALTVLAIGLQVTMILTLVGLSRGMVQASVNRTRGIGADIMVRPAGSALIGLSSAPMSEKYLAVIEKLPHVAVATGTVIHAVGGLDTITGIDYEKFVEMSGGVRFLEGGPFRSEREVIIDDYYSRQRNLHPGDTTSLSNVEWKVAGVMESGKLARVFVPIRVLQDLTANTGKLSVIYVKADDPKNVPGLLEALKKKFPDNPIYSMEEFLSQLTVNNIPGLNAFITVIVALSVIFGFLVVFLAMYTAVLERTREIGILKALGATPGYVLNILVRETVVLALVGTFAGILFTFGTRAVIVNRYPASLTQVIVPDWWPIALAIALAAAVAGTAYPGIKAARQDAIEALAYE